MKIRTRLEIILPILVLGLCAMTVFFVTYSFNHEEGNKQAEIIHTQDAQSNNDYVEVQAEVLSVDPLNALMLLRLGFTPHGRFVYDDELLSTPLQITVSDLSGTEILFEAGKRMFPREVRVELYHGEVEAYPFDTHRALFEILVHEQVDATWQKVPAQLDFLGYHHGYKFVDTPLPATGGGYIGMDIEISRSPLNLWTAIFCMAIIWGLTITNLFLLWTVLTGRMEVDLGLFGYMSGFIVAMYFFRQILPDIPPFLGVYADYIAFFWAELVAAVISIIFAIVWFRKMAAPRS